MRWTHLAAALFTLAIFAGCAAQTDDPNPATDEAQSQDLEGTEDAVAPTYATTGPIITAICGECHAKFTTLDGIKAERTQMIAKLKAKQMPKNNLGWNQTPDGKLVLKWLKTGADVK